MRHAIHLLVLAAVFAAGDARAEELKIVVHPDNPVTEVSRGFLREAFLKKSTQWSRGETIRPIDLARKYPVRERFTREVVKKTPAQLKSYWSQQIFSGKGVPPPEADTTNSVIAYVLANRGAVGYVPAGADTRGAKVVKVK
jgi:ABC-type phosphate transport system substrate-binding protein